MATRRRITRPAAILLVAACATATAIGSSATPAQADCGMGPPFALAFGKAPRLLATLHATETLDCGDADGREYDYVVKGYFKVADRTVARLPSFSGHADPSREHIARPSSDPRATSSAQRRGAAGRVARS